MWEYFERKVCLTNDPAEWDKALAEFNRVGLDVQKFQALPHIGPHQSFNASTRKILIDFLESENERLLFLEDDCVFKEYGHLETALKELPTDWDVVYLGANIQDERPVKITDHIYRVRGAWTTHCIGYNKKAIPFILENQPGFSAQMYDNWLSGQYKKLNTYVVNPMIAWQRPRYSSIWKEEVDYNEHFINSQNKLI